MPPWRPLPLTLRIWRWSLSLVALLISLLALTGLPCLRGVGAAACRPWLEAPQTLNASGDRILDFIFGANWTPGVAAFLGYLGLVAYGVGLVQWLLVRLPRQGRVAGEF